MTATAIARGRVEVVATARGIWPVSCPRTRAAKPLAIAALVNNNAILALWLKLIVQLADGVSDALREVLRMTSTEGRSIAKSPLVGAVRRDTA